MVEKLTDLKVIFDGGYGPYDVVEYAILPSGKIVVMCESAPGYPESYWSYSDGTNPKGRLVGNDLKKLIGGE